MIWGEQYKRLNRLVVPQDLVEPQYVEGGGFEESVNFLAKMLTLK